ncbi:rho guanine nucleotide exchange factor 5 isoform X2 [Carettochelys insculpta]|uniref:rho guanine nucleotide exchange factor 5 isoform X2 n=1 Tax=Carettochelys insculpta TaxID=44489 RepID=UPI003EBD930B
MKYLQPQGRQKNLNLIPIVGTTAGTATGAGLKAKHWPKNPGCDTQQDVSLMESEEANVGDPIPPATSSATEENPDPVPAEREHHAISESTEMSRELLDSVEGAQICIVRDALRHLSVGESAEMCGRSSDPVSAGLEQGERDLMHQRSLSELEKDPAEQETSLETGRWDHSSDSAQGKLAYPESSQYSSFLNTVPQAPATDDTNLWEQSPALHMEFPADQNQSLPCHAAVPHVQHKETSVTDTVPSQREPATKHFLVCEEISEVHCKTEILQDDIVGDSLLQGLDLANGANREHPPRTETVAGTDRDLSLWMDAAGRMKPMPSVDDYEKVGGLQGGGKDTDSCSSHLPSYPLLDDSQGNSHPRGVDAGDKMALSSQERGNNPLATDQKTGVAARQSPSGSINLLQEEKGADDGRAEGSTESPEECIFHTQNSEKNTEEEEEHQHPEQIECGEEPDEEEQAEQKQAQLEWEEPERKKWEEKVKPVQEELAWERENQKEKRWDKLEQEPGWEEAKVEALPPALSPSPLLSQQNWQLCDAEENISSADGTGQTSVLQESFSEDDCPDEFVQSSRVVKACSGRTNAVLMSDSQNPVDGSCMTCSPACHISEHWGDLGASGASSSISVNGQDCGQTSQDDAASNGEDNHSGRDGWTVQSLDDGGAISPFCREVTLSSAENPDPSRTLDLFAGAKNLGSLGYADPASVAENAVFSSHYNFTPASPSELNSAASAAGPSQDDADESSHGSPVECTDLEKAPSSVQDLHSQTSPYLQEAACVEGVSVSASTECVQTPHGLLTPEKGLDEKLTAQPFTSQAFRSCPPRQSLSRDREALESTSAATMYLESSEASDMAPTPHNYLEEVQRQEKPPARSSVSQGAEMEANIDHQAQQNILPDQSHLSLQVEVPGTGSALNSVFQPPEETVILALEQHTRPPLPKPDSSSPLVNVPGTNQLTHPPAPAPSSPLSPVPDTNQLVHPLAPAPSSPLSPVPDVNQLTHPLIPAPSSPLSPVPGANQLTHPLAPAPSSPLSPVPDTNQLVHPPAPAPSSPLSPVPDVNQLTHPLIPALSSPLSPVPGTNQLVHPPAPAPSSPPSPVPDVNQLTHPLIPAPSSPLSPVPGTNQLVHPPAPAPSSPPSPVPDTNQLTHPLIPAPSSPLSPVPDTNQLVHPLTPVPSSPRSSVPDTNQLVHPPTPEPDANQLVHLLAHVPDAVQLPQSLSLVPNASQTTAPAHDIDQPLPPLSSSRPPLECITDSSHFLATAPTPSCCAQAPASVPDADSLVHALVPASAAEDGEENPLQMQKTREVIYAVQWDSDLSLTPDVVDTSDSGVTLLAKKSDFPSIENEGPQGHSDISREVRGQHLVTQAHSGKPTPDVSWPSLGWWGASVDSHSRDSAQPSPVLAFSNPIHFLQLGPPSPPAIRTLYRQEAVFEEPQWDQAQAGPTSPAMRNTSAPAVMTETAEGARILKQSADGQREPLCLMAPVKGQVARHAPLEKSSSCPDKVIRMDVKEPRFSSGSQENEIKCRAKSKDWHRQGLKKTSVVSYSLPEEGTYKDHRASSDKVIFREKQPVTTLENLSRRHSKLIHSSKLLYQEYSDVALNKAIQSQKRADSLAEDLELNTPSSPRLRRKGQSPQDSYLQRLSVSANASLWQDIPMIRGSRMLLNMSRDDQKLQETKFELIMSEASYLRSLNVAVDHFQRSSELQALLTNQERKWLFSRLQEVHDVSASFLFDLEEKFEENMFTFNVCDVALRHAPEFRRVYLPYVTNQTYQEQIFQRLMNGNARFQQALERLESDPVCQRRSLKSFLILPFQRITRLKLLLQNILKRTPPESEEEVQATQAYDALEKLIKDCNENVQRMKNTEELIYLRQKIDFECKIFPLVSQSRRLVKCAVRSCDGSLLSHHHEENQISLKALTPLRFSAYGHTKLGRMMSWL